MKLSETARITVKRDSTAYNSMLGCDIINRLTEDPPKQKQKNNRKKEKLKAWGGKFRRNLKRRNVK
ncbi:MAG: hypothetical protein PHR14_11170 [Oscillospiraceae bacterium]|nr:hypothetical protein [Oscillospiraceae bacterium]